MCTNVTERDLTRWRQLDPPTGGGVLLTLDEVGDRDLRLKQQKTLPFTGDQRLYCRCLGALGESGLSPLLLFRTGCLRKLPRNLAHPIVNRNEGTRRSNFAQLACEQSCNHTCRTIDIRISNDIYEFSYSCSPSSNYCFSFAFGNDGLLSSHQRVPLI
jgi:hypothetical protein